jgi:hypothetical protein
MKVSFILSAEEEEEKINCSGKCSFEENGNFTNEKLKLVSMVTSQLSIRKRGNSPYGCGTKPDRFYCSIT